MSNPCLVANICSTLTANVSSCDPCAGLFARNTRPAEFLGALPTDSGRTLAEISSAAPLLVVFVRHFGCSLCREALSDIAAQRGEIAATGAGLAVVHMDTPANAREALAGFGLADVPALSDPDRCLYRALDVPRASWLEILSPRLWWRAIRAGRRHGAGLAAGDKRQGPGAFVVREGRVVARARYDSISDRQDWGALARSAV
ncbi:MAG: AhpC/TSA family protein [Planctomycetes bacterium]|nr:AhpC/TSA family protein [Planctomycetota bacterium]